MDKMGSPMGSGNPPGAYSDSYLNSSEGEVEQFMTKSTYESGMDVGVNRTATVVGNQPQENKTSTLEARANREQPY